MHSSLLTSPRVHLLQFIAVAEMKHFNKPLLH